MMYVSCHRSFLALSLPGSPVRHSRKEARSVLERERERRGILVLEIVWLSDVSV